MSAAWGEGIPLVPQGFEVPSAGSFVIPFGQKQGQERREPLCTKGLFFICPSPVHDRIMSRVGKLDDDPIQSGSVTFLSYSVDQDSVTIP